MPRTKDTAKHHENAIESVVNAYALVRNELRAKTRLRDSLNSDVVRLQERHDELHAAAVALGITRDQLSALPEPPTNEAKIVLTK